MKRYIGCSLAAVAAMFLQGCIGTGGQSAAPPNNVVVTPKDSRVVVTWDMAAGVEYWIYKAAGAGVTPENCASMSLCTTTLNAASPATVANLANGLAYSFSINARASGGPGGAGSLAVSGTPRLAGDSWRSPVTAVIPGTTALRGVAYGASGTKFVAAGVDGALYSGVVSTNAAVAGVTEIAWTLMTNPLPATTDLNAVNYDVARAKFVAVGEGGAVIAHVPSASATWTPHTSGTTEHLHAVANNGAGVSVAVGDHGKIIYNSDGGTAWTVATTVPSAATTISLYGAGYGTTLAQNVFVAVGASRTLLYSTDNGVNWLAGTCATCTGTPDLKAVTYGGLNNSGKAIFVAVGNGGTVLTSENGVDWTQLSTAILSTSNLNAITYAASRRFVAVGADGNVYYSDYYNAGTTVGNGATTWTHVTSAPLSVPPLNSVATGGLFDYLTVGDSGVNLYAD